jgi:hypothetical protein
MEAFSNKLVIYLNETSYSHHRRPMTEPELTYSQSLQTGLGNGSGAETLLVG